MWPFTPKAAPALLDDIQHAAVDPGFAAVLADYSSRNGAERLALCLEGGGAKGRWQAGFFLRLEEIGLAHLVDVIAGTSVGGMNTLVAARYIVEGKLQQLVNVWRGITSNASVYRGALPTGVLGALQGLVAGKLNSPSWLDTRPLEQLVERELGGDYTALEAYVVATHYDTKKAMVLGPAYPATQRALATSAVPGAFPARKVDGIRGSFMDGGCVQNCPYPFLIEQAQATKLIVLYCDPDPADDALNVAAPTTVNTLTAAVASMMSVQSARAFDALEGIGQIRQLMGKSPIEMAHFYPSVPTGGMLEFGEHPELLQQGYDDAVKFLTVDKVRALLVP